MKKLYLYTQQNCGLCEEAKIQIKLAQDDVHFDIEEINIQNDDALHEMYCLRVPVLYDPVAHIVVQEGQIDFITIIDYMS
ncbi:glutaredoxin family protein [Macrococcoides caseolyticum]|uniref:glutaredoxin family protein n=1 Tax=Macrococcoides caseolyticum TaxID=69966 RepID=UPI001F2F5D6C|nr:glutaredoxin family protein [Macrococcus caseolyticus]MCE4955827.1 glutaredoxin family protein [Macrococcus caseolyticus]